MIFAIQEHDLSLKKKKKVSFAAFTIPKPK